MLQNLSVIIPTFNRHSFALRAAKYYRSIGVKVIFADGTTEKNNKLDSLSKGSKYVKYMHFPDAPWSSRMLECIRAVDCKYVVISADDEFHLASGLIGSLNCLEKHQHASCAVGRSAKFTRTLNGLNLGSAYNYSNSYNNENPVKRTSDLLRSYSPFPCYSVWRKNLLGNIIDILSKTEWSSWRVDELIHVTCASLQGYCYVHNDLQWLRSDENPPSKTPTKKQIEISEWYSDTNLNQEHLQCFKIISSMMTDEFFKDYSEDQKINTANYFIESYLDGQKHHKVLVKAGIKPQKNFAVPVTNGRSFIKQFFSMKALKDFELVETLVNEHYR